LPAEVRVDRAVERQLDIRDGEAPHLGIVIAELQ
jgi:hypothetical protein